MNNTTLRRHYFVQYNLLLFRGAIWHYFLCTHLSAGTPRLSEHKYVHMNVRVNRAVGPAGFCEHTIVRAIPVTFVFVVFNCVCIRRFLEIDLNWN